MLCCLELHEKVDITLNFCMSDIKPQPAVSLEIKAEKGSENKPPGLDVSFTRWPNGAFLTSREKRL